MTVASGDGTRLGVRRSGAGPPLLLVHGATHDHRVAWRLVVPGFEPRFTVYAMDRRGRGSSGDASTYSFDREAEDVAAVVDSIDEPANVVGHSYGGLCAIEAALLTANMRRLILYEAVPLRGADNYAPGWIERLEAQLEAGDLDGVLIALMRDVIQRPSEEIALMRSRQQEWAERLQNARTIPRELRAEAGYIFDPERFRNMRVPTLLLVGGDSPRSEMANAEGVAAALPHARVGVLPGQRHTAMHTAPEVFVREVTRFVEG